MLALLLGVSALLIVASDAQQIRQCTCAELEPCSHINSAMMLECSEQCQRHVTALGVSYPAVRQCEAEISGALDNTINCIKRASAGTCARGPPRMIPKTYLESFKLAFLTRIKGILSRSGIFDEMMAFFKTTKKYWNCKTKCVAKKAGNCKKRNGCGTLDPPDREAVEMYLNCAVQNGLDTNGFRRLCHCAARAGVRNLDHLCDRVVVP